MNFDANDQKVIKELKNHTFRNWPSSIGLTMGLAGSLICCIFYFKQKNLLVGGLYLMVFAFFLQLFEFIKFKKRSLNLIEKLLEGKNV